jgi:hypothetical protein
MRAVLYAKDFEPITVIDVPEHAVEHLLRYESVRLPVVPPVETVPLTDNRVANVRFYAVDIWAEKLRFRTGAEHLMLFTYDEEAALLLKSAFLPGQQAALNRIKKDAFAKGFLDALHRLGG